MLKAPEGEAPPWTPRWTRGDWEYDFRVCGHRFRKRLGVRSREGEAVAIEISRDAFEQAWAEILSPFPTFAKAAHTYMINTGKHKEELLPIIRHFGPHARIDQIDVFRIEEAVAALIRPTWNSPDTARRQVRVPIKAVLNHARGNRSKPRVFNRREYWLSPAKAERLIDLAMNPERAHIRDRHRRLLKIIVFMLATGCGPGETFAVRAEDCNWATSEVWIRAKEVGAGKTSNRERWVHVPPRAVELIGELPAAGHVFVSPHGLPYELRNRGGGQIAKQFRKLCRAAALPDEVVCYTLRHTWATWFSAQVRDHDLLLDRGGWAKSDMARHYRKKPPRDLADRLFAHGWDFRSGSGQPHFSSGGSPCKTAS